MNSIEKETAVFIGLMIASVGSFVISVPISSWNSAGVVQKQLNSQCGTNYSQMDVLLSGDKLTELCKIKSQELLIKQ